MVDLSKISKKIIDFVNNVEAQEGSKKKIDTKNEYNQLAMYLAGNSNNMGADEIAYLESKMQEGLENIAKRKIEEEVTPATKKLVKKIMGEYPEKK